MSERARIRIELPLAPFTLSVDFTLPDGTTVLFGPSGAGKTSVLESVAGLRRLRAGEIILDGVMVYSSERGVNLPPEQRRVGYVPQDALLFPHRTVEGNLGFGMRRESPPDRLRRIAQALEIEALLPRRVETLSGGERRRVALGRALLSEPRILLLDEPLAGTDLALRHRLLPYLRRLTEAKEWSLPTLLVTHDIAEARSLASRVILIDQGAVVGSGPAETMMLRPAALAAADEVGLENVFDAEVIERSVADGVMRVRSRRGLEVTVPLVDGRDSVAVGIGAGEILVALRRPEGITAQNIVAGRIEEVAPAPRGRLLRVAAGEELWVTVTARAVSDLGLGIDPGREVFLVFKAQSCRVG